MDFLLTENYDSELGNEVRDLINIVYRTVHAVSLSQGATDSDQLAIADYRREILDQCINMRGRCDCLPAKQLLGTLFNLSGSVLRLAGVKPTLFEPAEYESIGNRFSRITQYALERDE